MVRHVWFDTLQDYITCAICTHTRFAYKMYEYTRIYEQGPHILFHFASHAGDRANCRVVQTEPIFLLPCGRGCVTGDLVLQSFAGRSLFCWMRNIWSIWGPFIWSCRSTRGPSDHVCLLLVKLGQTLQLLISWFNLLNCFPPLLLR